MRKSHLVFISLLLLGSIQSNACFILFLSDGKQVLVGNHEDWFAKDAAAKINAPAPGRYGSVIFTFLSEGWAQGGMNEKGLFFDAARTPVQEISFSSNVHKYPAYIWQAVLDKCATVAEAISFLNKYELPELSETDIMLADAEGHAVIIGADNGKVAIKSFVQSYLMQTNFNPWQPQLGEESCWRYQKAQQHLSINATPSVENMKAILAQTHQDSLTLYSNIYDLKNKVVYTYNKRNFKKAIVISLPDAFRYGNCISGLDSLEADNAYWKKCKSTEVTSVSLSGKIIDERTGQPISYANIGILEKNIGTLSDPDGSFELEVPFQLNRDSISFSSIGFTKQRIAVSHLTGKKTTIALAPSSTMLAEVIINAPKKSNKIKRLGWMGGKDGVLPLDSLQGGGAIALLVRSPSLCIVEKLQVRLMYNSKDTSRFRLHFYAYDSIRNIPGRELLSQEIILKDTKRFGWMRFDLSGYNIPIAEKNFLIGFEWIEDHQTRKSMQRGLLDWEKWKKDQYEAGNKKAQRVTSKIDEADIVSYRYEGNMMDWPGFGKLPPFTGLMIKKGKEVSNITLKTFERKTSFGQWHEIPATLNAVVTVSY